MRAILALLIFGAHIAVAAEQLTAIDDLKQHLDSLTLIVIGRPEVSLPKVGKWPCFSKLHVGKAAFGTQNDAWFGGGTTASDQKVTREEMAAILNFLETAVAKQSTKRAFNLAELKSAKPGYSHLFEREEKDLTAGAIALGYAAPDSRVVYYLIRLDDRDEAIRILAKLQEKVSHSESASAVIGNVLWRLNQRDRRTESGKSNQSNAYHTSSTNDFNR